MQLLVMRVILEFRICFIVIEILLLRIMLGLQYPKLNLTACLAKTVANRLNALLRELIINNFVALRLWRMGARDILELPLLATSSKMETALMAGQT